MLKQRVWTAVVMALLFLSATFTLPLYALAVLFGLVAVAGSWEWATLASWRGLWGSVAFAGIQSIMLALSAFYFFWLEEWSIPVVQPFVGVGCLFWSIAFLLVQAYPAGARFWRHRVTRTLVGWFVLTTAWLSFVYLASAEHGRLLVVMMVVLVVCADIGAFFSGKMWGRHKLAPDVSPGKTWEGFWGGLVAVIFVTTAIWIFLPNTYTHIPLVSALLMGVATGGASVVGDLTLSMAKRASGMKDSGALLPGHGGLLDRLDSLCAAAPVFTLALILVYQ
jgi:phosphatidate cytidylyltransferase